MEFYIADSFIHSFIPLACAEFNDSLPFSGASSIPLCYVLFPATLLHQLFFHTLSPHLAIYFLVYLSILLFPKSYTILFWEFYFLPFSVHVQTNIIYLTLRWVIPVVLSKYEYVRNNIIYSCTRIYYIILIYLTLLSLL